MSECNHEWKRLVDSCEILVCHKCLMWKQDWLELQFADLRAQLEAAHNENANLQRQIDKDQQAGRVFESTLVADGEEIRGLKAELEAIYQDPCNKYPGCGCCKECDNIPQLRKKNNNLQAQVGMMRGALEEAIEAVKYANKHVQSDSINEIINKCETVLSTTPEQAGERVRGLVQTIEDISNVSVDSKYDVVNRPHLLTAVIAAREALEKYRGGADGESPADKQRA